MPVQFMRSCLLLVILLFTEVARMAADPETALLSASKNKYHATVEALQHFRFCEAGQLVAELEKQNRNLYLLASMDMLWWKGLVSGPGNQYFRQLRELAHEQVYRGASPVKMADSELFLKIMGGVYLIRIAGIEGNKIMGMKAFGMIEPYVRVALLNPQAYDEYLFISGIYNFIGGSIRSRFILLRPLFLAIPSTDVELGRQQLGKLMQSPVVALANEACYFMYKAESEINLDTLIQLVTFSHKSDINSNIY